MRVAMLLSGGVDSSVACQLLKEQGHEVHAFYLKMHLEDEAAHLAECPWEEDVDYASRAAERIGVPLKILSIQRVYWEEVVERALEELREGRTPNPDIFCNARIKFGLFLRLVGRTAERVASGHYAQLTIEDGLPVLRRSPDAVKDQTYFLARLAQGQLRRALFPIGHLTKEQVRSLARERALPTMERKESQGICFLGKVRFREFLKHHLGTKQGDLIEYESGERKGRHEGHWFYTAGQREGLGLGGGPWYVVGKLPDRNVVLISRRYEELNEERTRLHVRALHWFAAEAPKTRELHIKLRHGPALHRCTIEPIEGGLDVTLAELDQGIAPGQYAVFYEGDRCLGSGIIAGPQLRH